MTVASKRRPTPLERYDSAVTDRRFADAREIAARIETDRTRTEDQAWRDQRQAEIVRLERARGGKVEVSNARETRGRIRVLTRGGLQLAFERGDLDGRPGSKPGAEALYEVAKAYRDVFERVEGMTSPTGAGTGRGEGPQPGMLKALDQLQVWRAVLSVKQLAVLNRVCGMDLTIGAAAKELRAGVPSVRRALHGGLVAITEVKPGPRPNRIWADAEY